jgi:hypothetical protein
MGFTPFVEKNVNSDLKNGMQQHGSVFRIPEEITSLDYFSLSSTDSFSNMEEEYMRKKTLFLHYVTIYKVTAAISSPV